jgi:Late exocytosis, associated with Golgi transport
VQSRAQSCVLRLTLASCAAAVACRIYEVRTLGLPERSPPKAHLPFFAWIKDAMSIDEATTLRYAGLDTYVFLR